MKVADPTVSVDLCVRSLVQSTIPQVAISPAISSGSTIFATPGLMSLRVRARYSDSLRPCLTPPHAPQTTQTLVVRALAKDVGDHQPTTPSKFFENP